MKSYCLLLVLLCSVFAIQSVNCGKLRAKAKNFTPTKYFMEITEFNGVEARDVGVGADGTIWYIGNTKNSDGDYSIYRIQPGSSESELMSGAAQYISVDPNGNAWTVNKANKMFKYVGTTSWSGVDGKAYDISCSPDGNFYHIGTDSSLYWRTRDGKSWSKLAGTGVRIAGGLSQSVWHVNSAGSIYRRYPGGDWEQVSGAATDIAVGANGLVWVVTKAAVPNQFAVYDEHLQDWVDAPVSDYLYNSGTFVSSSKTTRIAVAPNGDLLGVREDLSMFRLRFNWSY